MESLWHELQGRPSGLVVSIVQERKHTQQPAVVKNLQKRVMQRLCLPSKRQRRSTEPTTILEDEQLRLDAAALAVHLSWSWAPLQHGLGHDVPEFMAARRRAAQTKAVGTAFEATLMHGAVKACRQLETWSRCSCNTRADVAISICRRLPAACQQTSTTLAQRTCGSILGIS